MGKLTARPWNSWGSPLITAAEANKFIARCSESHTQQWLMNVYKYYREPGDDKPTIHYKANDVPIISGTLVLDSSDSIRRRLQVQVGGGEEWEPSDPGSPLAPFGQWIGLFTRIDYIDGTVSPWLQVFSGPIQSVAFERPSLVCTLEATDSAQSMEDFLHLKKKSYNKFSLRDALANMVAATLPEAVYDVKAPGVVDSIKVRKFTAEAGQSRLEAAHALAAKHGYEVFFDWNNDFIIRKDITDEDDNNWNPAAPGGDIGTVTNPVVVLRDGRGGNLIGMTTSTSREGAANAVVVNLSAMRDKKKPSKLLFWQYIAYAGGSIAYGDTFGRMPVVINKDVSTITDAMKDAQTSSAKRLLKRRKGLMKYIDLDALPIPYLEPDDKVKIIVAGQEEDHYVQRIEFDLGGGPMKVRTRTLAVTDIVPPPEHGPTYYDKVMSLNPLWYLRFENPTLNIDSAPYDFTQNDLLYGNSTSVPGLIPTVTSSPGLARSFPGTANIELDYADEPPTTNPFTFVAGVKFDPTGSSMVLTSIWGSIAANANVICGLAGDGRPWMRCYKTGGYVDVYGPASVGGTTHHLTYSFHGTTHDMKIYVDGVQVALGNLGAGLDPLGLQRRVGGLNSGNYYKGVMDEPVWFDYCFTDAQAAGLYAAWKDSV